MMHAKKQRNNDTGKRVRKVYQLGNVLPFVLVAVLSLIPFMTGFVMCAQSPLRAFLIPFTSPLVAILNYFPVLLLLLAIYLGTSRLWISWLVGGGFALLSTVINSLKLGYRNDPFTISDLMLGGEAFAITKPTDYFGIGVPIMLVAFVAIIIFLARHIKTPRLKRNVRIIGTILCIAVAVGSYFTLYNDQKIYDSIPVNGSLLSMADVYKSRGFFYSFLYNADSYVMQEPKGYSIAKAKNILAKYKKEDGTNDAAKLPNVIAIMSEAFFDADRVKEFGIDKESGVFSDFHTLQKEGTTGYIVVNCFGGGTENTEFSFLTGNNPWFLPATSVYRTYIRNSMYALPRAMSDAGFTSYGIHPGYSWFYNRENVYRYFGFNETAFREVFDKNGAAMRNGFYTDDALTDYLLKRFNGYTGDTKNNGTRLFEFAVSIENHEPYAEEDQYGYHPIKARAGLDENIRNMLNNYLYGANKAQKALAKLTDQLQKSDKPVVLVFFGDHLPFLGEEYLGYKAVGSNIGGGQLADEVIESHKTPYLIWCNDAAKALLAKRGIDTKAVKGRTISASFLSVELMDYIGMQKPAYLSFLKYVSDRLPVITDTYCIAADGTCTTYEKLPANLKKLVDEYKIVQYYMLKDDKTYQ